MLFLLKTDPLMLPCSLHTPWPFFRPFNNVATNIVFSPHLPQNRKCCKRATIDFTWLFSLRNFLDVLYFNSLSGGTGNSYNKCSCVLRTPKCGAELTLPPAEVVTDFKQAWARSYFAQIRILFLRRIHDWLQWSRNSCLFKSTRCVRSCCRPTRRHRLSYTDFSNTLWGRKWIKLTHSRTRTVHGCRKRM